MEDHGFSKIEQLLLQIAEWKAKFFHEREWRESVQKEKEGVQEKYAQIVYELGTQKKAIEQLEEKVKLLSSGQEPKVSDIRKPAEKDPEDEKSMPGEVGEWLHGKRHPIYTNPHIYQSTTDILFSGSQLKNGKRVVHVREEVLPHILHRYDPEFHIKEPPVDTRHPLEKLDEVLAREINNEKLP